MTGDCDKSLGEKLVSTITSGRLICSISTVSVTTLRLPETDVSFYEEERKYIVLNY